MKYVLSVRPARRLVRVLFSALLMTVIFLTSSLPAMAISSDPTDGTVQLNEILERTQKAIDSPATTLKSIEERSEGGLNEVQGTADYSKMNNRENAEIPAAKKAEKVLDKFQGKMKNEGQMKGNPKRS
jgi:hypothetical protein